ncbi:HNH endonuclease family protein [Curtobacterium pusillum]|uniref:HNH endonuclease family protein n=1 Tax=Curtobacterium pusillum TaxID=69373 RepID=UPI0011A56EEC|nr:HNH endonuclease family protein [Curtobacterium pusillum]
MRRSTRGQLLAAAALVAAVGVGTLVAPYVHLGPAEGAGAASTSAATPTSRPSASGMVAAAAASDALQDLRALPVSDAYVPGYDRALFGQAGADVDHNGCDTRNDVLRRDLVDVVTKPGTRGCVVLSGTLHDPYTGRTIAFTRGETSSLAVQIDHRYPLALAWRHGAASWTTEQREAFANDQTTNLIAVDGQANEDKSDSGPGEWMPQHAGDACAYATSFVAVSTKWRLSIATDDEQALDRTLTECMTQGSK